VRYTVTNGSGCSDFADASLTINDLPTVAAIAGGQAEVCLNDTTAAFTNATAGGTWSIVAGTGTATINGSGVVTATGAGTVTVRYTVTNGSGCSDFADASLTINDLPVASLTSSDVDNTICTGDSVTFTGSGGDEYEFLVDGLVVQAQSTTATYTTTSLTDGQVVTVRVVNTTTGCDATSAGITISVNSTVPTVNNLITNDTTPVIGGTANSAYLIMVMVNGVTYTEGDGNLVDNGDDTWTLNIPAGNAIPEGTYDVSVDNVCNDVTTDELVIDTTAPTVPTVNSQVTNDTTPVITGTADSADTITVTVNGVTYTEGDGNLVDNGDGTWTLNIPAGNAIPEGTYDVSVTATDAAGNTSSDVTTDELVIDTTAPTVPTVNSQVTNDTTPVITGTADSADTITVTVNGVTYTEGDGNLVDNGDGTWTLNIPAGNAIPEGTYDVSVTATDAAGNTSSDVTTDELVIDTTAPTVPTVNSQVTNDTTPVITGTADSADTITVTVNGVTYTEGDGNLVDNGDGTWTLNIPAGNAIPEGTYDVSVTATDAAGNTSSDVTTDELVIDTTAPTVPTVNSQVTNDTTPVITGTADSADTITVTVNGVTYTEGDGNLVDNGDGTWTLNIPAGNAIPEGTYDVSVTATDAAGNTSSDVTTDELVIDTTAPTVPTVNSQVTNDTTPVITGTADSADTITVTVNGVTYTEGDGNLVDNGDGTWTLNIPAGNAIPEGTYDVSVTATDAAGNASSDVTTDELVIDTTAPTVPTVNSQVTNDTTPVITGTADSADTITVTVNGVTYTEGDGNLVDNGDGTWTLNIPAGNAIPEGTYDVSVTATDAAGNTSSDVTTDELVIDTTAPTVPTVNSQVTNDTTPVITGTADSADTITVTVNGVTYTEGDGNLVDNGDGTWTLNIPAGNAIPEGTYDVSVTATDAAGNTSSDVTTDELVIDTTAPTVPTVNSQVTNDTTPVITGTADSADTITVTVNGVTYTEGDGNLVDNGDGTWTLNIPAGNAIPEGTYDVSVTATDAAGNTSSDVTTDELVIDTTAPTVPTVNSQVTNDTTPVITGTADSADTITVTVNGVTYTEGDGNLVDNGDGTWTLNIPAGNAIPEGTYDVSVTATDAAGNTSSDVTTDELVIDTTAPTVPTVNSQVTNDTTPVITGTADSADTITVTVNGVTYTEGDGNLVDNGDGTWTLNIPAGNAIPEGTYDVSVTATDAAGNTSSDVTTDELVIDTTAPTVPTVNSQVTNDTTPVITGTADSADTITVTVNGVTYTEGDGNLVDNGDGTWTLNIPAGNAIPDGTYDVSVTATDAAGNTSSDVTTDELVIDTSTPTVPTVDSQVTNDTTPVITGTADSADTITVTVNGVTYTEGDGNLVDNGDGTWTLNIPAGNEIPVGTYDVSVEATNGLGNMSSDVTIDELVIITDTDGDGVADEDDLDDDNDGIPDAEEGTGDTDNDGIPNNLDLDSDNDGILDVDEGGNGDLDVNGDGVIDSNDGTAGDDLDGDGQADASVDANEEPDTDNDGTPDYLDLDSDNDGINDVIEDENVDANNDGIADGADSDGDGIADSVDPFDGFGEGPGGEPDNTDSDNDGTPDYLDLDSDDDGINDIEEGGNDDPDGNGVVDGADSDGDGILDEVDDDVSNFGDTGNTDVNDTDPTDPDSGGSGTVDDSGTDSDGDGIADSVDGLDGFGDAADEGCIKNENYIISPNGDSTNQFLYIPCIDSPEFRNNSIEIFNRWGNVVFKMKGYSNIEADKRFEGISNGRVNINVDEKLPVGTYFYILDLGNGSKLRRGWIYINR
ncbi:Ig-like domain-containing protein, partial [uncultured Tenacibaculum sp.]|uniref:Ig-like domain-containing protein n=1 Tax=uncultured Tenacibaculum sp. TaxID=174713 RepID=UPI0026065993